MDAFNQRAEEDLGRVSGLADHIHGASVDAVRSLQFEDIVSQSVTSVERRLQHLGTLGQPLTAASGAGPADLEAALGRWREALAGIARPVSQQDMSVGEVELF